ncbi:MAG TPA: hypothetical protein VIY48_19415, partial [Candidatus Paceibacterota bacterium]
MPTASVTTRVRYTHPVLRGLKRCGYDVVEAPKQEPNENDILVTWNRLHTVDPHAKRYEAAGAKVVVCENGWIGKDTYAISLGQHNGAGWWRVGDANRWSSFGIEVKPYRTKGEHILV